MKWNHALMVALLGTGLIACDKKEEAAEGAKTKTEAAAKQAGEAAKAAADKAGEAAAKAGEAAAKAGEAAAAAGEKAAEAGAAAAGAAGAAAAAAAGGTPFDEKTAEEGIKLMEEMATLIDANKEDCDKAATELKGFMEKNKDAIAKMKNMKPTPEQDAAMKAKYGDRLKAVMGKMMGGAMKCQSNPKFAEAMKAM